MRVWYTPSAPKADSDTAAQSSASNGRRGAPRRWTSRPPSPARASTGTDQPRTGVM
ncbi:hypothetical protein ACIU1J_24545 [Azospirillum doebereinerae]|uniref:hypothetical protein n=1 Tax=Azospirillum doebereinerae TaxID=92933 RepID=UPI00384ADD99